MPLFKKNYPPRGSVRVRVRNTVSPGFKKNSPPTEPVRVEIRVRVMTPCRGSVRVRSMISASF